VQIRPLDFTAKLLSPKWKLKPGEADPTVMQVIVEGETDTHSMARTTGYTATVAIRMLAAGMYDRKGISPPEFLGRDEACVDFMLRGLEERGGGVPAVGQGDPTRDAWCRSADEYYSTRNRWRHHAEI